MSNSRGSGRIGLGSRGVLLLLLFPLLLNPSDLFATPPTVAVSYFDNTSGEPRFAPLSKGLADMLITDLSAFDGVRIVEREKLEQIVNEIELGDSGYISSESAQRLGRGLGASYILTGAFLIYGDAIRIDSRVVEVESGEVLLSEAIEGSPSAFLELQKSLAHQLIETLGLELSRSEQRALSDGSADLDAAISYSAAIEKIDQGEIEAAAEMMDQLISVSPDFLAAYSRLDQLEAEMELILQARNHGLDTDFAELVLTIRQTGEGVEDLRMHMWSLVGPLQLAIRSLNYNYSYYMTIDDAADVWLNAGFASRPETVEQFNTMILQSVARQMNYAAFIDDQLGSDYALRGIRPAHDAQAYLLIVLGDLAYLELAVGNDDDQLAPGVYPPARQFQETLLPDYPAEFSYADHYAATGLAFLERYPDSPWASSVVDLIQAIGKQ